MRKQKKTEDILLKLYSISINGILFKTSFKKLEC